MERSVAEAHDFEIVSVVPLPCTLVGLVPSLLLNNIANPVEVEHTVAHAGLDIGDTAIGMHVKFVQVPVRPSLDTLGAAHVTALRSRPKYVGGPRATYDI